MEPNKKGSDALAKRISWQQNPTPTKKLHRSSYTKSVERKVNVLIACMVHGPQPGVMISPDLSPYSSTNAAVRIVELNYQRIIRKTEMVNDPGTGGFEERLSEIEEQIDSGNFAEAALSLEQSLRTHSPDRRHFHYLELAESLRLLTSAKKISETWPKCPTAVSFLGRKLYEHQSDSAALQVFQEVVRMPNVDANTLILAKYHIVLCALRLGDADIFRAELAWLANARLDESLQAMTESVEAYIGLAICETSRLDGLAEEIAEIGERPELEGTPIGELLRIKSAELSILKRLWAHRRK